MGNGTSQWEPEADEEYEAAYAVLRRRFAACATRRDEVFDRMPPQRGCSITSGHTSTATSHAGGAAI